jgi:hypothetical protein
MKPTSNDSDKDRARRAKAFDRRKQAAIDGIHLPTLFELYCRMPFYGNSIKLDMQAFSERLLPRVRGDGEAARDSRRYLSEMTVNVDIELCLNASAALDALRLEDSRRRETWVEASNRCLFYAACHGHAMAMAGVAGMLGHLAEKPDTPPEAIGDLALISVGLMLMASDFVQAWTFSRKDVRELAFERGTLLYDRVHRELNRTVSATTAESTDQVGNAPDPVLSSSSNDVSAAPTVVVLRQLGNSDIGEAKKIEKEFKEIRGKPLPLSPLPNLDAIGETLNAEFPHANLVTRVLLSALVGRPHIAMRPTILVGPPGSGKTAYAERFLDILEVPNETYPCGGVADSTIAGTSRRWSSGEPSLPVAMIRRHASASPAVILDELEKASLSRQNGSLYDALLSLFEVQTATKWVDPYIQAPVDVSHVLWMSTANTLKGIPAVLIDRCRVILFPEPRTKDLPTIAHQMLKKLAEKRGLKPDWAFSFSVEELDAMSRLWSKRSLRTLERLVEAVFMAREKAMTRQ